MKMAKPCFLTSKTHDVVYKSEANVDFYFKAEH